MTIRLLRILSITCLAVFIGGCFNPEYGDGGFACSEKKKDCPSGYVCLRSGAEFRCLKEGTFVPDAAYSSGDAHASIVDAAPPTNDVLQKLDQKSTGDVLAFLPTCEYTEQPTIPDVISSIYSMDQAIDPTTGIPHLFLIDSNYSKWHLWRTKTQWVSEKIGTTPADRLAATIDGDGTIHVAFRTSPSSNRLPYHTAKLAGVWSAETLISNIVELGANIDIEASGKNVFIVADRNIAAGSTAAIFTVTRPANSYVINQVPLPGNPGTQTFSRSRISVRGDYWGVTSYRGSSWSIVRGPIANPANATATSTGAGSDNAAPLELDANGYLHVSLIWDNSTSNYRGQPNYLFYNGISGPLTAITTRTDAYYSTSDIAVDGQNRPHIIYYAMLSGTLYWSHLGLSGGSNWIENTVDTNINHQLDVRVDNYMNGNSDKRAYFAYIKNSSPARVLVNTCKKYTN